MVDASLRMSIVSLFRKLKEELGVSVLYITHDLATAYYVSDRIAIMFRGNIVEMGTVEQVPADIQVGDLLVRCHKYAGR